MCRRVEVSHNEWSLDISQTNKLPEHLGWGINMDCDLGVGTTSNSKEKVHFIGLRGSVLGGTRDSNLAKWRCSALTLDLIRGRCQSLTAWRLVTNQRAVLGTVWGWAWGQEVTVSMCCAAISLLFSFPEMTYTSIFRFLPRVLLSHMQNRILIVFMKMTFQNVCPRSRNGNLVFKPVPSERRNVSKVTFGLAESVFTALIPQGLLLVSYRRLPGCVQGFGSLSLIIQSAVRENSTLSLSNFVLNADSWRRSLAELNNMLEITLSNLRFLKTRNRGTWDRVNRGPSQWKNTCRTSMRVNLIPKPIKKINRHSVNHF